MRRAFFLIPIAICLCSCRNSGSYMPLESGATWTYSVRTPYSVQIEPFQVTDAVPVGSAKGWKLESAFGEARLRVDGETIWMSASGNSIFHPPIPLSSPTVTSWEGEVITNGKSQPASAQLELAEEEIQVNSRKAKCRVSRLKISIEEGELLIETWFARGIGIFRQDQRRDGKSMTRLEWINGPKYAK